MDTIQRLICALVLLCCCGLASAQSSGIIKYRFTINGVQSDYLAGIDGCLAAAPTANIPGGANYPGTVKTFLPDVCIVSYADGYEFRYGAITERRFCSDGVDHDVSFVCPAPPPSCSIGAPYPGINWDVGYRTGPDSNSPFAVPPDYAKINNQEFCTGTCTIGIDRGPSAPAIDVHLDKGASPNGYYGIVATANFITTGGTCVVGSGTPAPPGPGQVLPVVREPGLPNGGINKCPAGTSSGGIDSAGTPICLGTGTAPTSSTTTTKAPVTVSNADGGSSKTTDTSVTNPDGSVTTTSVTITSGGLNADGTAKDPSTTTKKNTTAATNGTPGKSDTPESDLCKLHPELNICKNSSVSGSCETVACEGDAIQCSQLRTQQTALCEQQKMTDLGTATAALAGDSMAGLPTTKNGVLTDVAASGSSLDTSGFAGGGACFSDKTVSIGGRSVTISYSAVCGMLGYLKYAVLLIAMIGAYRIIGGALLRET